MQSNNKKENWIQPRATLIIGIVLAAAALRVVPHPMNFAPIGALALFGGAYFASKRAALAIPLLSLIAGDIFVGFHRLIPYVYASFLASVAIGFLLRQKKCASHWCSHARRRNPVFPGYQFRGMVDVDRQLSKKFARPGRMLSRGRAIFLEHAGG